MSGLAKRPARLTLIRKTGSEVRKQFIGPFRVHENTLKLRGRNLTPVHADLLDTPRSSFEQCFNAPLKWRRSCGRQQTSKLREALKDHRLANLKVAGGGKVAPSIPGTRETDALIEPARMQHFTIPGEPRNRLHGPTQLRRNASQIKGGLTQDVMISRT